jgi:23S rRNA (cytosine1962-C5)-methyltransferase
VRPLERAIRSGHPWVYQDGLKVSPRLAAGPVDVLSRRGKRIARGMYDPSSPIAVRVWSTDPDEEIGPELVAGRLEVAWAYRRAVMDFTRTNAFRLCNGEGDRLPGLVIDVYGHTAVLRIDSAALEPLVGAAAEAACATLPDMRRVLVRQGGRRSRRDADAGTEDDDEGTRGDRLRPLIGRIPDGPVRVLEHGAHLEVDVAAGHKTGAYLDQRENRLLIRRLAGASNVLDICSYTGGFGLSAALGGAVSVTMVDVSGPALAVAARQFTLNGLDIESGAYRFERADAFEWLARDRGAYDLVVLDPPSMASSAAALRPALDAYRRLNALALARVKSGGLLFTASCSSHVTEPLFMACVRDGAADAGRPVRTLVSAGAGPDHPNLPALPEGRYLNAVLLGVD